MEKGNKKACCYKCEKRVPGCHGSCEDYKRFKAENDAKKQEKGIDEYVIERTIKKREKYLAKNRKRK